MSAGEGGGSNTKPSSTYTSHGSGISSVISIGIPRVKRVHVLIWVVALMIIFGVVGLRNLPDIPPEDKEKKSKSTTTGGKPSVKAPRPTKAPIAAPRTKPPSPAPVRVPVPLQVVPQVTPAPQPRIKPYSPSRPATSPSATRPRPAPTTPLPPHPRPAPSPILPITPLNATMKSSLTTQEQKFVDEWCDLSRTEWYPTGSNAWQQRAPYFIIPGARHTGTTSLYQALILHPQIANSKRKEVGFFYPNNFLPYHTTNGNNKQQQQQQQQGGGVKVFAARQRMYAQDSYFTKPLKESTQLVALDGTSGYLFYSQEVPQHVLCVAPWTKLVIVIRNPVDRVFAHWAHGREKLGLQLSLEDWLAQELNVMQSVGLVPAPLDVQTEDVAWKKYQNGFRQGLQGGIGKSLYVLQLRHWFEAFREAGKEQQIHIVVTEDLNVYPHDEFAKVLQFLNLPDFKMNEFPRLEQASKHVPPMKEETRRMLQEFFSPYNDRLLLLLQEYGFGRFQHIKELWK